MARDNSDKLKPSSVGIEQLPQHVAFIMDGNGRWARKRGQIRLWGHRQGAQTVRRVVKMSYRLGVRYMTLFAFSSQNWGRPTSEVNGLMELLLEYMSAERRELLRRGVRFRAVGDVNLLSDVVRREIKALEEESRYNTEMDLNIAISYGAREEILRAVRAIARDAAAGKIDPEELDEESFGNYLYTAGVPDPDLLIRTSGEQRISNFMLWQIAYTELYITRVLWPDFDDDDYLEALRDYSRRQRRFGLTGAQATKGK